MNSFCKHECLARGGEACALAEFGGPIRNVGALAAAVAMNFVNHHDTQPAFTIQRSIRDLQIARAAITECIAARQADSAQPA